MIRSAALLALAATLAAGTAAHADGHFERTLSVSASPDVYVVTGSGNIVVHPGSGDQVHIVGHISAEWSFWSGNGQSASAIHQVEQNPPIEQSGNSVHIGFHPGENQHVSIDYDITVPANAALDLHSGSGDVRSTDVGRFVTAGSGSGKVVIQNVHGGVELSTGSGDISAELTGAGDVKLKSGSGNIHVRNFIGMLNARTGSGDIDAQGRLTGPATLLSGSGNIKLHLGGDARFNLESATGSGNINVDFPGAPQQDEHSRHHLTGPVNGGGAPLEIRTGSGDIRISS